MGVIRLPRFMGGHSSAPEERRYEETEVIKEIGKWLSHLETEEEQFRCLTYWLWRLKSKDNPRFEAWAENVAEESAEMMGQRTGFGRVREIEK